MRRAAVLLAVGVLAAAGPASAGRTPLDGRWKMTRTATTRQLIAHGTWPSAARAIARLHVRIPAVELRDGQARWFDLATGRTTCTGTFLVRGDRVGFAFSTCAMPMPHGVSWMRWTVFRNRLAFSALPGRAPLSPIAVYPWVRVS
jgi:hypothetical protein